MSAHPYDNVEPYQYPPGWLHPKLVDAFLFIHQLSAINNNLKTQVRKILTRHSVNNKLNNTSILSNNVACVNLLLQTVKHYFDERNILLLQKKQISNNFYIRRYTMCQNVVFTMAFQRVYPNPRSKIILIHFWKFVNIVVSQFLVVSISSPLIYRFRQFWYKWHDV